MSSIILFIEARRRSVSEVIVVIFTESILILTFNAAMLIAERANSAAAPKSVIALALQFVANSLRVMPSNSEPDRALSLIHI